jgi:hypothetical protein
MQVPFFANKEIDTGEELTWDYGVSFDEPEFLFHVCAKVHYVDVIDFLT